MAGPFAPTTTARTVFSFPAVHVGADVGQRIFVVEFVTRENAQQRYRQQGVSKGKGEIVDHVMCFPVPPLMQSS